MQSLRWTYSGFPEVACATSTTIVCSHLAIAIMAPFGPWSCCFRPKVAEHDLGTDAIRVTPREDVDTKAKCIEDSANANGFGKLHSATVRAPEPVVEDAEEFGSPTSSYATCFSEEDPGELSARCFSC